jgi:hypothetical protein
MSRSIAEEPFKAKQDRKFDQEQFYFTGENKVGASSDDSLTEATMASSLINLPKATYEVAQSITKHYPLPRFLIEAYLTSNNPVAMLAAIPIIKTGLLTKSRCIGPKLSRKIYTLMMSVNPEDIFCD